jgi:tetratricopeptide (TPR) repeat protein
LLDALADVRQPEGESTYPTDWRRLDYAFRDLFQEHGLHVDGAPVQDAARELGARGVSVELAAALDEWSGVRRRAADELGASALAEIADALDPDPARRALRRAIAARDAATSAAVAQQLNAAELPPPTLRMLAHAWIGAGRLEEAIALLEGARRRHPRDFVLAMELARALMELPSPRAADAAAHYEAALALRPENVEAWHELGRTLGQGLGQHARALAVFEVIAARRPDDGHLHFHVGHALSNLALDERALASYRRSVECDPGFGRAHLNLGVILVKLDRLEEALACLRRAIELEPADPVAHFNIAVTLLELGRGEEAIASAAVEMHPDSALANYNWLYSDLATTSGVRGFRRSTISTGIRAVRRASRWHVV